jgi:nitroimidazol reductase NimA-like FMN-containing flavoprotein (pyridoxamine 5'-phosphate oxidase superfamily)
LRGPGGPEDEEVTPRLSVMPEDECRELLHRGKIGRVSVTHDALPVIAPVNYVMDGNSIVFRTRRDGMLANACDETVIAFEIDDLAGDGSSGWSVNVVGVASLLGLSDQLRALSLGLVSAAGDDRDQFVRLRIGLVTGRRVTPMGIVASNA